MPPRELVNLWIKFAIDRYSGVVHLGVSQSKQHRDVRRSWSAVGGARRALTLCGALSNLFTPAIWLMSGTFVKKVYVGGRVGSGKFVLLNGSVSSRYWTLHCRVVAIFTFCPRAIVFPCELITATGPAVFVRSSPLTSAFRWEALSTARARPPIGRTCMRQSRVSSNRIEAGSQKMLNRGNSSN